MSPIARAQSADPHGGPGINGARQAVTLGIAIALPLAVGGLGAGLTADSVRDWYPTLVRPSIAPPSWVFGPVWTTLFVLMGVASWRVWRTGPTRPDVRSALGVYGVQLGFNLAWSWIFFGLRQPLIALGEILILLTLIVITARRFAAIDRLAGGILIPYAAWVTFATLVNAAFWWVNR